MIQRLGFHNRRYRVEWLILVSMLGSLAGLLGYMLWDDFRSVNAAGREQLKAQAQRAGQVLAHELTEARRALRIVARDPAYWSRADGHDRVKTLAQMIEGVHTLRILDTAGRVVASSRDELIGAQLGGREYFQAARARRDAHSIYLSHPYVTLFGTQGISLSTAVVDAKNDFAGVVAATFDLDELRVALNRSAEIPGIEVALAYGDSYILPPGGGEAGEAELAALRALLARHHAAGGAVSLLTDDAEAGGTRLAVLQTVRPANLQLDQAPVVIARRPIADTQAQWSRDALKTAGLFGVFALLAVLGLHFQQSGQRRVDAAASIHAAERRKLSQAVEQAATAIVITDVFANIEYVNPACCRIYGYAAAELIGRNPRIFQSGLTPREVYRSMWDTILGGETWRGELTNRRRDGGVIQEATTISPVRGDDGSITHFVAIKEDITEKRVAEYLHRDLEARKGKVKRMELLGSLAGGIAHDFNNMLVAILGFSSLGQSALRDAGGPVRVIGYLEEIETAGERAKALVQQLLIFGRGGRMKMEAVRVADAVGDVLDRLRGPDQAAAYLSADVAADLPPLTIDPAHLDQLLLNLCRNSLEAMNAPGRLVVSARRVHLPKEQLCDSCHGGFQGEFICIAVKDDGPGISAEIRERIFEPFYTTKEVGRGSGMGLAVVHGVAHLYEGHLQLRTALDAGTELAVFLPLHAPTQRDPSATAVPQDSA